MIFGIGIDSIEISRIKKQIDNSESFKTKIFTTKEIEYCDSKKNYAESYAARFAAKEAFLKAIGTGWRDGLRFSDIEILNDDSGKPQIYLYNKAKEIVPDDTEILVSLTHTKSAASAVVVLERNQK